MSETDDGATVLRLPSSTHGYLPGAMRDVIENVPGLSYRRLDFWSRTGRLKCTTDPDPGSGILRLWDPADYPAMRRMLALVDGGVHDLDKARALAFRETSELAPGCWVTFAPDLQ